MKSGFTNPEKNDIVNLHEYWKLILGDESLLTMILSARLGEVNRERVKLTLPLCFHGIVLLRSLFREHAVTASASHRLIAACLSRPAGVATAAGRLFRVS